MVEGPATVEGSINGIVTRMTKIGAPLQKQRRTRTFKLIFAQVREGSAIYKFADGSEEVRLLQLFE